MLTDLKRVEEARVSVHLLPSKNKIYADVQGFFLYY